ncbi:MAG: hypothetical protein HY247_01725 [archaeon]|nr:MAG: hypothetical protein HY247_01725 [archaeon]
MSLTLLFFWIQGAFVALAFLERSIEGDKAGGEATWGWRKSILGYRLKEYHFWLWFVVVPLFVYSPLLVLGPDIRAFLVLTSAFLVGGVLEDFVYFLVNPHYGIAKWNSRDAKWMPWFKLGRAEVPQFYVRNLLISAVALYLAFAY